jgi:hypothetical protein
MQKAKSREGKSATSGRKSGRTTFDKSGRGIWEWQTATGVFEQNITDEQLAQLEDSQLAFIGSEAPKDDDSRAVSYYEWQEKSYKPAKLDQSAPKTADVGKLKRLLNRLVRKS